MSHYCPRIVGRDLGDQAGEQTVQGLGPVALQREKVLQLRDDLLDELPFARRPAAVGLWPRPTDGRCPSELPLPAPPVSLQPTPLPCGRGESLVGQVGFVVVGSDQCVAYRSLVAVGRGQPEGRDDARRLHHQGDLEPIDHSVFEWHLLKAPCPANRPLRQALTRTPLPGPQGRLHDTVDRRGVVGERFGHTSRRNARSSGSRARILRSSGLWSTGSGSRSA